MGELLGKVHQIEPLLTKIYDIVLELTDKEVKNAIILLIVFISAGTLFSIILVIAISRTIYKLLGGEPSTVAEIANNIAEGNLTQKLEPSANYSGLLYSIVSMKEKLEDILSGILENANSISTASEQLSSTSSQIAQGANESASSVEEVTTTIKEISTNIEQNTENAQQTDKTPPPRRQV
jgi:methyl-accepting chemotaxis protein